MIQATKQFCRQCDTRVTLTEAARCPSIFCKAKRNWPTTSGRYQSAEILAAVSIAPLPICQMIFAIAGGDRQKVAAVRGYSTTIPLRRMRQAVIWTAKERGFSFHKIARALNRDHSTVMHAHRIAKELIGIDAAFQAMCAELAPC